MKLRHCPLESFLNSPYCAEMGTNGHNVQKFSVLCILVAHKVKEREKLDSKGTVLVALEPKRLEISKS